MPMHGPAHQHFVAENFVKQHMLLERMRDDKESPVAKARMGEGRIADRVADVIR